MSIASKHIDYNPHNSTPIITNLHNTSESTLTKIIDTLPTGTEDLKLMWQRLNMGGIQILDIGLAVHEHDLIAALTVCVSSLCSLCLK